MSKVKTISVRRISLLIFLAFLLTNYFGYAIAEYILNYPLMQALQTMIPNENVRQAAFLELMGKIKVYLITAVILGLVIGIIYNLVIFRILSIRLEADSEGKTYICRSSGFWMLFYFSLFPVFGLWEFWLRIQDMMRVVQPISELSGVVIVELFYLLLGLGYGGLCSLLFNFLQDRLRLIEVEVGAGYLVIKHPFRVTIIFMVAFVIFVLFGWLFTGEWTKWGIPYLYQYLSFLVLGYLVNLPPVLLLTKVSLECASDESPESC